MGGNDNSPKIVPVIYHGILFPNLFEFVLSDKNPTNGVANPSAIYENSSKYWKLNKYINHNKVLIYIYENFIIIYLKSKKRTLNTYPARNTVGTNVNPKISFRNNIK